MKYFYSLLISTLLLLSCDNTTEIKDHTLDINLVPHPKEISEIKNSLQLSNVSTIYFQEPSIRPLAELFSKELELITGISLEVFNQNTVESDIQFSVDPTLNDQSYKIEINKTINLSAGSYEALTMAKTTLLQLVKNFDNKLSFPRVDIVDQSDVNYRGLLIDLARKWHSFESVKQLIDLAAFYKIRYIQLHFTDYQSYTLPSKHFPKLATQDRHYSFDQLKELELYSKQRGVTIIPELEVPGHASQFVKKYPEIFAIQDTITNPWIINMGKEEVYSAIDTLIGELVPIFNSSPYFHIGGDEAIFTSVEKDPDVLSFIDAHNLEKDVHELYRYFLVKLNEIVKSHGKQMCVWEGFGPNGKVVIPKDIIVYEFETNRYLPNELIDDGYTVVNTSWKPLYVVNQKKWEPETIYNWNIYRWENWWEKAPSIVPIQIDKSDLVIGAQMCSWEQEEKTEIPSLRKRLPFFVERIWNTEKILPYVEINKRVEELDFKLSLLLKDSRQDSILFDYNWEG